MREERPEGRKGRLGYEGAGARESCQTQTDNIFSGQPLFNPRPHMGGCHPPQVGFVPCTPVFEAEDLIFAIAAF